MKVTKIIIGVIILVVILFLASLYSSRSSFMYYSKETRITQDDFGRPVGLIVIHGPDICSGYSLSLKHKINKPDSFCFGHIKKRFEPPLPYRGDY